MSTLADMPAPLACPRLPRESIGPCVVATRQTGAKYIRMVDACERCGWVDPASLDRWAFQAHSELMDGLQQRISLASNMHPFMFVEQTGVTLTLPEAISQAMAAAAVAWERPETAGRYDAERAKQIGLELYRFINEKDC